LARKLRTVVMNDPPGDIKLVNEMVFDEVNNTCGFNFSELYSFHPH